MSTSTPPIRRKRGAQRGNSNRFKHGLYSRDAKARRRGARELVPLMDEALVAFRTFATARRNLNATRLPKKKLREIDDRMTAAFFQSVRNLAQRAAALAPALFEPLPAPAPRPAASGHSNEAEAVSRSNLSGEGRPLPQESDERMPGPAFEERAPAAETAPLPRAAAVEPRRRLPVSVAGLPLPIPWWTAPSPVLRYRP